MFGIKGVFDEKERMTKARLEKALSAVSDKPSERTIEEENIFVVVESREVVRGAVVGHEEG